MKIKPKLSIIIPVYNTENYLNECLLSVTSQQLKDIEIIIVNDGSTDRSSEIIRTYANADPRICIIDVDNGGQGRARNLAIEKVSGEYIGFVDSDDRIEPGMFRELFDLATSQNSDVSICEIAIDDAEKRQTRRYSWTEIPFPGEFDGKTFCYDDIGEQLFKLTPSPFNKIYRTEFVKKIGAKFAEGCIYEDLLFVFTCLLNANAINYIRKPLYTYRHLRTGSTSTDADRKQFDIFPVMFQLQNKLIDSGIIRQVEFGYQTFRFWQYYYHYHQVKASMKDEFWQKILKEYNNLDAFMKKSIKRKILPLGIGLHFGKKSMNFYHRLAGWYSRIREIPLIEKHPKFE